MRKNSITFLVSLFLLGLIFFSCGYDSSNDYKSGGGTSKEYYYTVQIYYTRSDDEPGDDPWRMHIYVTATNDYEAIYKAEQKFKDGWNSHAHIATYKIIRSVIVNKEDW